MRVLGREGSWVAATRLSRIAGDVRKIRAILRLAWRSLGLLSIMLFAGSCIVADPPEYRAPGQTRPSMLFGLPVALDLLGQRPFVDFGRTVIDAEGADLAEGLLDDCFA